MIWATRAGIHVDRAASAWLIARYVDPDATFVYVDDPDDVPTAATAFDMLGCELSHHGDDVTFETILRTYDLLDPVLWRIAEIVHQADVEDDRFDAPEAAGLDTIIRALGLDHSDEEVRSITATLMTSLEQYLRRETLGEHTHLRENQAMRLAGKVALITGGASGIGRESSLLFSAEGAKVAVVDRNHAGAAAVVDEITEAGGTAIAIEADVSSVEDAERMVATTENTFGALHVLFNNAGIMHADDTDAVETEESVWNLTVDINMKGVWLGCRFGIPAIRRVGGGSVINTASFVAVVGAATPQIAYTASKGGVLAMSRELAVVHARENIRVNALCPGPLHTELLMSYLNTEEKLERRRVHIPMGRFGEAGEIAKAALFLASDESSYVTGTDFMVDGGVTAAYVTPE